jgi:hypothetical protein
MAVSDLSTRVIFDRWVWLILSEHGPPEGTTRLVLLAMSQFAKRGNRVFPSEETLAKMTGLTPKTVRAHVKKAIDGSWLQRRTFKKQGHGWRRFEYIPQWPPGFDPNRDPWLAQAADRMDEYRSDEGWNEE